MTKTVTVQPRTLRLQQSPEGYEELAGRESARMNSYLNIS